MQPARLLPLVAFGAMLAAPLHPAHASDPPKTELSRAPVASPVDPRVLSRLTHGEVVARSSIDDSWNAGDRARLRALGLDRLDGGAVALRYVRRTDVGKQLGRLRALARFVQRFAPSGLCDSLAPEGDGRGLCTGASDGPLGKATVRLPFATELREDDRGAHFSIRNTRPLEAKALFSWTRLVAPDRLRFAVDLTPAEGGWVVDTRMGVEMCSHASAAKDLVEQFTKLDAWLTRELAKP